LAIGQGDKSKRGKSRGLRSSSRGVTDWGTADAQLVVRAIERASFTGGAIRFGYSRDGGAYSIGIYGDGDPYTTYRKPDEDLDEWLTDIIDLYDSIADDQANARKGKKKPPQGDEIAY